MGFPHMGCHESDCTVRRSNPLPFIGLPFHEQWGRLPVPYRQWGSGFTPSRVYKVVKVLSNLVDAEVVIRGSVSRPHLVLLHVPSVPSAPDVDLILFNGKQVNQSQACSILMQIQLLTRGRGDPRRKISYHLHSTNRLLNLLQIYLNSSPR